jgi:hypothetical protein
MRKLIAALLGLGLALSTTSSLSAKIKKAPAKKAAEAADKQAPASGAKAEKDPAGAKAAKKANAQKQ